MAMAEFVGVVRTTWMVSAGIASMPEVAAVTRTFRGFFEAKSLWTASGSDRAGINSSSGLTNSSTPGHCVSPTTASASGESASAKSVMGHAPPRPKTSKRSWSSPKTARPGGSVTATWIRRVEDVCARRREGPRAKTTSRAQPSQRPVAKRRERDGPRQHAAVLALTPRSRPFRYTGWRFPY